MSFHNFNPPTSLGSIANSMHPDMKIAEWFAWPPNVFALISMVLHRTGAYKICLRDNPKACWEDIGWQGNVETESEAWIRYTIQCLKGKHPTFKEDFTPADTPLLKKHFDVIKENWLHINIDTLRTINQYATDSREYLFAEALIAVLAIADYCARGIGAIGQNVENGKEELKVFNAYANLLLNNKGSLSTIPKFHGIVLPKMRTPQSGVILRGLSHYMTYHVTEVEVMWRSFPWFNNEKFSLNILAIPLPGSVINKTFEHVPDKYHKSRYFRMSVEHKAGDTKNDQKEAVPTLLRRIVSLIRTNAADNHQYDIVVLPELALDSAQYEQLLSMLRAAYYEEENAIYQLPIIISGVLDNKDRKFENELRMSIFFADRWYHISQHKHHRWQLDRNQIIQYKLENIFSTDRNWYEDISISQRRLTILAPNAWLALSSLICEDLARQEPVSDLIRGIGPTLLFALLSDGPQLIHRWSARYASVLADDPGTAVLSLTSKGMANRSVAYDHAPVEHTSPVHKINIGLWKDMVRGWRELRLNPDCDAIAFTISAQWTEEFTLDRRTDHTQAAVFRLDTQDVTQINLADYEDREYQDKDSKLNSGWSDIRELSAYLFTIDSIVDMLSTEHPTEDLKNDVDRILSMFQPSEKAMPDDNRNDVFGMIFYQIKNSWDNLEALGIAGKNDKDANEDFKAGIPLTREMTRYIWQTQIVDTPNEAHNDIHFYSKIVTYCEERLTELSSNVKVTNEHKRQLQIPYFTFLVVVNNKISNWKSRRDMNRSQKIEWKDVVELKKKVNELLRETLFRNKMNARYHS